MNCRSAALGLVAALIVGQACGPYGSGLSAEKSGAKPGAAANPMAAFPSGLSGDYVFYRDYSWKSPTWIGFLYYDDSTYGAVVVTPETGTKVSVLFRVETVDGKMILTGQNVVSQIAQKDVLAVNYLMGLLPDMYGWRMSAAGSGSNAVTDIAVAATAVAAAKSGDRSPLLPAAVKQNLTVAGFGGAVTLTYAPEVTLFNLQGMAGADGKPVLELARMGRVQAGEDQFFFDFTPVPEAKGETTFVLPASRKAESKSVDGITIKLDDQWTMVADNTFFLGDTAVLLVDTIDLSLLNIPPENFPLSMVRTFSLSSKQSWVIPSSFSLTGTASRFRIDNRTYDSNGGNINRDIKICIPKPGKKCVIISLSVSEAAYVANRAYFDALVQ